MEEFDRYKRIQYLFDRPSIRLEMAEWLREQNKFLEYIPILESKQEIIIDTAEIFKLRDENKLKDHPLYGWVFDFKEYKINCINLEYAKKLKEKKIKEKNLLLKTPQKLWIYILKTYPKDILMHIGLSYNMYIYKIKIPGRTTIQNIIDQPIDRSGYLFFFYKCFSGRVISQKRITDGGSVNDPYSVEI